MSEMHKITYHDLRAEARLGKLPYVIGRREERDRFERIVNRRINNNVLLVGPAGIGKTTLVYGWMGEALKKDAYAHHALVQLEASHLHELDENANLEAWYADALENIPQSVVFIDDFGREVYRKDALLQSVQRVYKRILKSSERHFIFTLEPHEYAWLEREHPAFVSLFETVILKEQGLQEYVRILGESLARLNARHHIVAPDARLEEIIAFAHRYPTLGQLPLSAIRILDESLALSNLKRRSVLRSDVIEQVVETKTGIPKQQLAENDRAGLRNLETHIKERVLHQDDAIKKISTTLQRAKLGLRDPNKPLGSFLLLGPSGVGKTETAKCVAELLFGRPESFVRFDMSEFQQDHTVQRLIGAPAGYVGFEDGGALTNALRKAPHSLVLLDEIEKAHPKVFDIFLQVLDDGRITSGQNETVDARNAVFIATSNAAVPEILRAFAEEKHVDSDAFIKERVVPILAQTFRLEFINRFDAIVLFKPLSVPSLLEIAQLEMRKIEKRFVKHNIRFEAEPAIIEEHIRSIADPRFGARPVKRFIEETCETLLADSLLAKS